MRALDMVYPSGADRAAVVDRLHRAHTDTQLNRAEFTDRVVAAAAAQTREELRVLTIDLPPDPDEQIDGSAPGHSDRVIDPLLRRRGWTELSRRGHAGWITFLVTGSTLWVRSTVHTGRPGVFWPVVVVAWTVIFLTPRTPTHSMLEPQPTSTDDDGCAGSRRRGHGAVSHVGIVHQTLDR